MHDNLKHETKHDMKQESYMPIRFDHSCLGHPFCVNCLSRCGTLARNSKMHFTIAVESSNLAFLESTFALIHDKNIYIILKIINK